MATEKWQGSRAQKVERHAQYQDSISGGLTRILTRAHSLWKGRTCKEKWGEMVTLQGLSNREIRNSQENIGQGAKGDVGGIRSKL